MTSTLKIKRFHTDTQHLGYTIHHGIDARITYPYHINQYTRIFPVSTDLMMSFDDDRLLSRSMIVTNADVMDLLFIGSYDYLSDLKFVKFQRPIENYTGFCFFLYSSMM